MQRDLGLVETRLRHLVEAVTRGEGCETLWVALKAEDERKKALVRQLEELNRGVESTPVDRGQLALELFERVRDLKGLLQRHAPQAREILTALLETPLLCQPVEVDGRRGYEFSATATYGRLLGVTEGVQSGQNGCPPPPKMTPS